MRKLTITIIIFLFMGLCNIQAEIIWDSGHHIYSEGSETYLAMLNDASADITGGWIGEFFMYNETSVDVFGGTISALLCQDISTATIYDNDYMDLLKPFDSSTANVYGGTINHLFVLGNSTTNIYGGDFPMGFSANDSPVINMYVQEYYWDPDGGSSSGFGLLTGTWLYGGEAFSIDYVALDSFDHIAFVPEPATILLLGAGGLVLRII